MLKGNEKVGNEKVGNEKVRNERSESEILIDSNEERTECEIWTRVMGYYRPVSAFNRGKQSEYSDRKCFTEKQYEKRNGGIPACPRVQQIISESCS